MTCCWCGVEQDTTVYSSASPGSSRQAPGTRRSAGVGPVGMNGVCSTIRTTTAMISTTTAVAAAIRPMRSQRGRPAKPVGVADCAAGVVSASLTAIPYRM